MKYKFLHITLISIITILSGSYTFAQQPVKITEPTNSGLTSVSKDTTNNSDKIDAFKALKATKDTSKKQIEESRDIKNSKPKPIVSKSDSTFIGKTVYIRLIYEKEIRDSIYRWFLGLHGGVAYAFHNSDGIECLADSTCPKFRNGNGPGFYIGGNLEYQHQTDFATLFRMTFLPIWANMNNTLDSARVKDANFNIVPLVREHDLSVYTSHLNFDLFPQYLYRNWRFYAGPTLGMLLGRTWTATSKIVSPNNVTFLNNKTDTTFFSDKEIQDANTFQGGLSAGVSYDFPISNHRVLAPELIFNYPFTNINSRFNWKQTNLLLGLSFKWGQKKYQKPRVEKLIEKLYRDTIRVRVSKDDNRRFLEGLQVLKKIDTVETEPLRLITRTVLQTDTIFQRELVAKITPWESNGYVRGDTARVIKISANFLADSYPILPIVFFDINSSTIPQRYNVLSSIENYSTERTDITPVPLHRNVLNIIGERMRKNGSSKIRLLGYTDRVTENGDCDLAFARARAVQNYLVNVWNIGINRIEITRNNGKCVPSVVSSVQSEDAYSENRRVEIETNNPSILAPVTKKTYSDSLGIYPPIIEYDPEGSSTGDDVASWNLDITQNSNMLFNASGTGTPKISNQAITSALANSLFHNMPVEAVLTLKNQSGDSAKDIKRIFVIKDSSAGEIKRLWLTFFKVAKNNLDNVAEASLKTFLSGIKNSDEVNIIGYADKLGNANFNRTLSNTRAKQVSSNVKKIASNARISRGEGIGSLSFPPGINSYDTPEERFLSRTVQINVSRIVSSKTK